MVNAAEVAMNGPAPTFLRGESMDDNDMFFMRPKVAAMALAGVGVLNRDSEDRAPADSEHWPLMMELSVEAMFAVDDEQVAHPRERARETSSYLYCRSETRICE